MFHRRLDGRLRQREVGRVPLVELARILAHSIVTAGFDVSQDALHSSSHFGVIGSMGGGALAAFEVANQTILLIGQFAGHGHVAC